MYIAVFQASRGQCRACPSGYRCTLHEMAMDSNKGRGGGATRLVYDEEKLKARARR